MIDYIRWLLSATLLVAAHYFWAVHDWRFWDRVTKEFEKSTFGDWHNVKGLMLLCFIPSLLLIPQNSWLQFFGLFGAWLLIRWASFDLGIHLIPKEKPYERGPGNGWWRWFYLPSDLAAMGVVLLGLVIGALFVKFLP